jgi:hypothetical protein
MEEKRIRFGTDSIYTLWIWKRAREEHMCVPLHLCVCVCVFVYIYSERDMGDRRREWIFFGRSVWVCVMEGLACLGM